MQQARDGALSQPAPVASFNSRIPGQAGTQRFHRGETWKTDTQAGCQAVGGGEEEKGPRPQNCQNVASSDELNRIAAFPKGGSRWISSLSRTTILSFPEEFSPEPGPNLKEGGGKKGSETD